VKFSDVGFQLAFGAVNYDNLENLIDDTRVEWRVSLDTYKNLQPIAKLIVKTHACTKQDFDGFYPVVEANKDFLEKLK